MSAAAGPVCLLTSTWLASFPADHINVALNAAANTAAGSKVVLVDNGSADGQKIICSDAAAFLKVVADNASKLKMLKLKGPVVGTQLAALVAGLRAAVHGSPLEEIASKALRLDGDEAAAQFAAALLAAGVPACTLTIGKKAVALKLDPAAGTTPAAIVDAWRAAGCITPAIASAAASAPGPAAAGSSASSASPAGPGAAFAFKGKAKVGKSVPAVPAILQRDATVADTAAGYDALGGACASAPSSVKVRGPLTPAVADALAALLHDGSPVRAVKFVRFWAAGSDDAGRRAAAQAVAAVLSARPAVAVTVKSKAESCTRGGGAAAAGTSVEAEQQRAIAAALLRIGKPPAA